MRNKIDTIIFDLGRVLINVEPQRGLFGLLSEQLDNSSNILEQIMKDPLIKIHNSGKIDSYSFYNELCKKIKLPTSFDQFCTRWCDIFSPIPQMGDLLKTLSAKYKLGLLSDTDPLHWQYIKENYSYLEYIEQPTLSFEINCTKPDKRAYLSACDNYSSAPANTLFIDDLQNNVDGAIDARLIAFRHESTEKTIQTLQDMNLI